MFQSNSSGVEQKIEEISVALEQAYSFQEKPGLFSGKAGSALFFFYYGRFTGSSHFYNLGNQILEAIFHDINDSNSYATMADGLAGIAWTIDHLVSTGFLDKEYLVEIKKLNDYLAGIMINDVRSGNYDYLHGGLGIASYLLKGIDQEFNKKRVEEAITILEQIAVKEAKFFYWYSVIDHKQNISGINLGLSHGLASIIYFLLNAYKYDMLPMSVSKMLGGSIQYLLDIRDRSLNTNSTFPNSIAEGVASGESRLAWCYGDPGIGMALWQAGKLLQNGRWESAAIEILHRATNRMELEANGIYDASICHGSAGLVQIFNRSFQETGDQKFYHAAIYWLKVTLDLGKNKDGIAGFKYRNPTKPEGWVKSSDFLEGIAGIGLVLISAVSDITPGWDECLMLS